MTDSPGGVTLCLVLFNDMSAGLLELSKEYYEINVSLHKELKSYKILMS